MIIDGSNMAQAPAEARPADVLLLDVLLLMPLLIGRLPRNILCMATAFTMCSPAIVAGANSSAVVFALSSHGPAGRLRACAGARIYGPGAQKTLPIRQAALASSGGSASAR